MTRRLFRFARARKLWGALPFAAIALAGCAAVGPDYSEPALPAPPAWQRVDASGATSAAAPVGDLSQWWQQLGDLALTELIAQALAASPDLRAAQARLREARARRALASANLYPSVTGSASASYNKSSAEAGSGTSIELYNAGFDASWEPDVFGGQRRAAEAAQADLERSAANLQDTQVSLAAEVALNYVDVRTFQARLGIARDSLASQTETLQITQWRVQAGLATALD
jgi:outer membrane protein TolC